MAEQCRDPESIRWTTVPDPYATTDAEFFLDEIVAKAWNHELGAYWAVEAERDGAPAFCGTVDVRHQGTSVAEIGYGLHPGARGQGIMTAACRLALRWAFVDRGLECVRWTAYAGNDASRRVADALGFRFEGTLRAFHQHRGTPVDCWVGSLHRDDPHPCW